MTEPFDLGPVPQRVRLTTDQVRRLVAEQLPQWADLDVRPVARSGWDNHTFHLGDDLLVRLPSAAEYAQAVAKEHRWLPVLAPLLPLPVPVPLALGAPSAGYTYPWSVYRWLPGTPVLAAGVGDPARLADDLGSFVAALRAVDPADGPRPGVHNWFRGGPLVTFDAQTRAALTELDGEPGLDVAAVAAAWDDALVAPWDGVDRWFHGDLAAGNLLLDDSGRLGAVIDFGTCGVGDPSCDLAPAWTLLDGPGRAAYRARLGVGDDEWRRGRGWALWKAVATCRSAAPDRHGRHDDPEDAADWADGVRVLASLVAGS